MNGQVGEDGQVGEEPVRHLRVGAYALVVVQGRVLLTQMSAHTPVPGHWGLPGGGIDHGEAPLDAVVREVREETGHVLRDLRLAHVGSHRFTARSPSGRLEDFHSLQVIYTAGVEQVVRPRVLDLGGSTEQAAWVPVRELDVLPLLEGIRDWLAAVLDLPHLAR